VKIRALGLVLIFFLILVAFGIDPAMAKDEQILGIPAALEPWKAWVLYGQEGQLCPTVYNNGDEHHCVWPSRLQMDLSAQGGRFTQQWLVFAKAWVALPGDKELWPLQVRVNGRDAAVVEKNGHPAVALEAGEYTLQGQFEWKEIPEMIHVPPESGLIQLNLNGQAVPFPLQESDGRLWLKKARAAESQEDRLEVRIYRLLDDGIPMRVLTLFRINVAGKAREVSLKGTLLEGFIPMNIQSPIPARINNNNELLIQARPGRWEISILARSQEPVQQIGPIKTVFGQEVWAFQPQNPLRMVKIEGVAPVDPGQTDSPDKWRSLATYLIDEGSTVKLQQLKRGDPDPAPDQLTLERIWWLDFNGQGLTIRDQIQGSMNRQWDLAMNPPAVLGRVNVDGKDQLITSHGKEKKAGVELRHGQLNLLAESRLDKRPGRLPAVGWDHDFQSVSGVLNLPPGWRLLAASGVDSMQGTWFERWTLLDLFLVLIISLAVYKLWSWQWGVMALLTLGIGYHEPSAPRLVWVFLLAAIALLRFLPEHWFKKLVFIWKWAALVVLLIISILFIRHQVRWAIYPQLEQEYTYEGGGWFESNKMALMVGETAPNKQYAKIPKPALAPAPAAQAPAAIEEKLSEPPQEQVDYDISEGGGKGEVAQVAQPQVSSIRAGRVSQGYYENKAIQAFDAKALNQTGPGLPAWSWRSYSMRWNGPVEKNQTVRFWLLSPAVNLVLAFLRVLLLAAMLVLVLGLKTGKGPLLRLGRALPVLALLAVLGPVQTTSAADFPPPEVLKELRNRLLQKPDCLPNCADSSKLELIATVDYLRLMWQVHAAEETAVPLPGSVDLWLPQQVLIDGAPAKGLARDAEGRLWAVVARGVHLLVLQGPIAAVNDLQIPLPLLPHQVVYQSDGWEVQGVDQEGRVKAGIKLIRKSTARNTKEISQQSVPPFFQVERIISMGLDWQVRSRISRLTPAGAPVVLAVPLLPGESVTSAGLRVENNKIQIQMDPRTEEVIWESTLKKEEVIKLKAPQSVPWVETWILESSTIWHADLSGIAVIQHQDTSGVWRPQWQPWPGEEVAIRVARPEAIPGQTKTIDNALLVYTPGKRFHKANLSLNLRSSQGDQHKILLPEGANLEMVKINDQEQPIRAQGRELVLPLQPGNQSFELSWLQVAGSAMIIKSPSVQIGEKAVNVDVQVQMPQNRWILWTKGPRLGPAVIFWSYLFVIILAAIGLGRVPLTPIKTWGWLLLGLGLTQINVILALVIVGWLLALGYRKNHPIAGKGFVFNLGQIGLVAWTITALVGLYQAVERGLLGIPKMQIQGNGSSDFFLKWTQDRISAFLPQVTVYSLPLFVFRILMLLWALWLAYALLKWLRWGWDCFGSGGLWRKIFGKKKDKQTGAVVSQPAPPEVPL
jgi:hypothetical protein